MFGSPRRLIPLLAIAIAIGLAAGWNLAPSSPSAGTGGDGVVWSHGSDGAEANAEEHWLKHASEFPQYHNAREYERAALNFVTHPPAGTLIKHRADGDTLLYYPATNTFAVSDADGEPRTFFHPDSGSAYWDRQ